MPSPNYIDVLPLNTRIVQLPFMGLQGAVDSQEIYMQLYNELPADLQKALTDLLWTNGGYKDIYNGDTVVLIDAQKAAAQAKDDIITTLTAEEIEAWASYMPPIQADYRRNQRVPRRRRSSEDI